MNNPLEDDGAVRQAMPQPLPESTDAPNDTPIADKTAEPKRAGDGNLPKSGAPRAIVIAAIVAVVAILGGLAAWKFGGTAIKSPLPQVEAAKADQPKGPLKVYVKGSIAHLVTFAEPKTVSDITFIDRDKKTLHLSDFKGQVVILNVWGTFCAPCRFEMPTLAHLQTLYPNKGLKILPISVDPATKFDDIKSFMDVNEPLDVYADQNFAAPTQFGITGMPSTLILDKQGREVARLDGQATWDTPEVKALVDKLLSE